MGVPYAAQAPGWMRWTSSLVTRRRCWWALCGSAAGLWRAAADDLGKLFCTELRGLIFAKSDRGRRAALAAGVRAPARAVAALPPERPDGRHDARHRGAARAASHSLIQLLALQHPAHAGARWCWCSPCSRCSSMPGSPASRVGTLVVCRDLHRDHRDRVADASSAGQAQRAATRSRTPRAIDSLAQLRDGQVLQQRALRASALRREPGAAAPRAHQVADHALAAQHRPAADHRHRRWC